MTNVHHLHNSTPSLRALDALKTVLAGGASIRAGWLAYGAALNEIKAQYPGKAGDGPFGAAVSAAGLDVWPEGGSAKLADPIKSHVRSAAMWAAALTTAELDKYEAAHSIEVSIKGGFRGLHAKVTEAAKPAATIPPPSPSVSKVVDRVLPELEAGNPINVKETAKELGVGRATLDYGVQRASGRLEGRAEVRAEEPAVDASDIPMSAAAKIEALTRQRMKALDKEFDQRVKDEEARIKKLEKDFELRVQLEVDRLVEERVIPVWQSKLDYATKVSAAHRGVMSKQEYNLILSCLHPDSRSSVSDEKLGEAFRVFREKDIPLLPAGPQAAPLPKDWADMLRRKKDHEEKTKAAKAAKKAKD